MKVPELHTDCLKFQFAQRKNNWQKIRDDEFAAPTFCSRHGKRLHTSP